MAEKKILGDHKKVGKKYIPLMLQFGGFEDVEWINVIIPELIWIGLINDMYGLQRGANICLTLGHEAHEVISENNKEHFFKMSAYKSLNDSEKNMIVEKLRKKRHLDLIKKAIYPLVTYYPECPLNFLFEQQIQPNDNPMLIVEFKKVLEKMFNRWETDATFVQANAIYIAFDSGRLKVKKGLILGDFPEVQDFPYTEKSKLVASSIRAALNAFFGKDKSEVIKQWSKYFWNTGLKLQKCEFKNYYGRKIK